MMGAWREEIIGDCRLICGDCREVLPTLGKVDAVVTDPPYGVNKAEWDQNYPDWLEPLAFSCAKMVCIMPGIWALPICVAGMGGFYRGIIAGRNTNGMTFGPIGFNNWIPAVVGGDVPHKGQDAFDFAVGGDQKPDHPSPKPLSFMLQLVDRVTDDCQLVLDPFMGSGTTGVACVKLGRKFIGIEIESKYFEIACRRIADEVARPRLPLEEPTPSVQLDLEYDGQDDLAKSFEEGYRAIRERVAAGGPGWVPNLPKNSGAT